MNTVKVFAEGVVKQIHDYLPAEYGEVQCEIQENLKNNGVRMVGVEFNKPDSIVSPVIYMESFYDDIKRGTEIESVMKNLSRWCGSSFSNYSFLRQICLISEI